MAFVSLIMGTICKRSSCKSTSSEIEKKIIVIPKEGCNTVEQPNDCKGKLTMQKGVGLEYVFFCLDFFFFSFFFAGGKKLLKES